MAKPTGPTDKKSTALNRSSPAAPETEDKDKAKPEPVLNYNQLKSETGQQMIGKDMTLESTSVETYERQQKVIRELAVINGLCFYKSSGTSSKLPSVWLPFFGINSGDNRVMDWALETLFIKPSFNSDGFGSVYDESSYPLDVVDKIYDLKFGGQMSRDIEENAKRFGSVLGLLISSQFGGSIWTDQNARELKAFLEIKYPEFYKTFPKIELQHDGASINSNQVNAWLKNHGGKLAKEFEFGDPHVSADVNAFINSANQDKQNVADNQDNQKPKSPKKGL